MPENMSEYDAAEWKNVQDWRAAQDFKKTVVPAVVRSGLTKGEQIGATAPTS